jgi:hypothetical protein
MLTKWACLLAAALGAAGCATSTQVIEPDGSTAWDVSCTHRAGMCIEEARARCGGAYVVKDQSVWGWGRSSSATMRVQCVEDYQSAHEPPPRLSLENASNPPRRPRRLSSLAPSELLVCTKAYERIDAMARRWNALRDGDGASVTQPEELRFLDVCTSLDEPQQLCLIAPYEAAHEEACAARIDEIPEDARGALDAMLLKPSGTPPPSAQSSPKSKE